MKIVDNFIATGKKGAILRRWLDDFKNNNAKVMFDALYSINGKNYISEKTEGKWDTVYYKSRCWYFAKWDADLNKLVIDENAFCYAFSISAAEHYKSTSYPEVTIIVFDEFLSRSQYLPDEFIMFMNVISTIVRQRDDVVIYMLGNTVNQYCPYFDEMGLKHIREMKGGTIDVYTYGENEKASVAVEMCADTDSKKSSKPSDVYFAFDNPKLKMITEGAWEIGVYPHKPCRFRSTDIIFTYFIVFGKDILQCEIVDTTDEDGEEMMFTFVHKKTTELRHPESDLIYSQDYSSRQNWRRKITKPISTIEQRISWFFKTEKVFYQDNNVGEIMRNYLLWCMTEEI